MADFISTDKLSLVAVRFFVLDEAVSSMHTHLAIIFFEARSQARSKLSEQPFVWRLQKSFDGKISKGQGILHYSLVTSFPNNVSNFF